MSCCGATIFGENLGCFDSPISLDNALNIYLLLLVALGATIPQHVVMHDALVIPQVVLRLERHVTAVDIARVWLGI